MVYEVFSVVAGGVNSRNTGGPERDLIKESIHRIIEKRIIMTKVITRKEIRSLTTPEVSEKVMK